MYRFLARLFGKRQDESPGRDVTALAGQLAAPAVHIVKTQSGTRSHLGGLPNLPQEFSWPERDGKRLDFLARLSLSEIQRAHSIAWLPPSGALLLFYDTENQLWGFDPKDRGSAVVLVVPDLLDPVSATNRDADDVPVTLPHRNVVFRRVDVLPSWERESVRSLALSRKESDKLSELADAVFKGQPKHQIAGFPAPVQNDDMELECQLVTHGLYCGDSSGYKDPRAQALRQGAENWRLLLQFDSDEDLGVMWGDAGTLYFWVEDQAARAGDFSNPWVILQCC